MRHRFLYWFLLNILLLFNYMRTNSSLTNDHLLFKQMFLHFNILRFLIRRKLIINLWQIRMKRWLNRRGSIFLRTLLQILHGRQRIKRVHNIFKLFLLIEVCLILVNLHEEPTGTIQHMNLVILQPLNESNLLILIL